MFAPAVCKEFTQKVLTPNTVNVETLTPTGTQSETIKIPAKSLEEFIGTSKPSDIKDTNTKIILHLQSLGETELRKKDVEKLFLSL